jgi:hypothetical protein
VDALVIFALAHEQDGQYLEAREAQSAYRLELSTRAVKGSFLFRSAHHQQRTHGSEVGEIGDIAQTTGFGDEDEVIATGMIMHIADITGPEFSMQETLGRDEHAEGEAAAKEEYCQAPCSATTSTQPWETLLGSGQL